MVSVSDRYSRSDDPMTPFGLRTTFIPPKAEVVKDTFTPEEALAFRRTSCDNEMCDQTIVFADGEVRTFKGSRSSGHPSEFSGRTYLDYVRQNYHGRNNHARKMLNDSTAYLGLGTFALNETVTDDIVGYIDSLAKAAVPNLIVDVRTALIPVLSGLALGRRRKGERRS